MPRQIEYDRNSFLRASTELFLDKGYRATSMRDIFDSTGMNRHSLYRHFGDKLGLYKQVLAFYKDCVFKDLYAILESGNQGIESIGHFFDVILQGTTPLQCVMIRTLSETSSLNKDLVQIAQRHFRRIRKAIAANLESAQDCGDVRKDIDLEVATNLVVGYMQGLTASSKIVSKPDLLRSIKGFLRLLR